VALDDILAADALREHAQSVDISSTLLFIETNFTDDVVCGSCFLLMHLLIVC
jgi:hypothetical protein